ncbi:MAG: hypothetical protein AB8H47_22550 [Bacteroidia bacterium]
MKHLKKIIASVFLIGTTTLWNASTLWAQCTQCKSAAAAKDEAGNFYVGAGLNFGILYLLFLPFILIAVVGGVWLYRNYQLKRSELGESGQAEQAINL